MTVAVIPRDTFAMTAEVVDRICEVSGGALNLIVVDTCMPPATRSIIEEKSRAIGCTLLRADEFATPNQIRNAVLPHVATKYVVFVDSDVLVSEGWLEALVNCAEETGAWIVGPLICERLPEASTVHGYDGVLEFREIDDQTRIYHDFHYNAHVPLDSVRDSLQRQETPVVEFHAKLLAMEAISTLGNFDAELANMYEYSDMCVRVREAGKKVMLEPASIVTYVPPSRISPEDRHFFEMRWGEAWTELSKTRLAQKYGVTFDHPQAKCPHNFARSMRMLGKPWLKKPRKILGRGKLRYIERKLLVHIDAIVNRRRYPPAKFGHVRPVEFRIVS